MKKPAAFLLLALTVACASGDAPEPMPIPAPAPDPRVAEMQVQLTELLERLDVMGSRLARLEENATAVPAPRVQTTRPAAPAVDERPTASPSASAPLQPALVGAQIADDYRQAIVLYAQGRHADARRAFEGVFEADSTGELADNALFWIGETWFAAGDYSNAVRYYNRVVNEFSDQNKAPDALFKTALAQEKSGDLALARRTLQQVIERYPYSSTASTAKAELQRIRF